MDNTQELKDEIEKGLKDQAWVYATLYRELLVQNVPHDDAGKIVAAYANGTTSKLGAIARKRL